MRAVGCVALFIVSCCLGSSLRNFQVAQPPDTRELSHLCTVPLLEHTFANSYGKPARARYGLNERSCGPSAEWSRLVLNLTATSQGRQYDRLGTLYLHFVEILRTSTAEPTPDGIVWTVLKDVTRYIDLFRYSGPLLLDLGNLLDPRVNLTGVFNVTLSVDIYGGDDTNTSPLTLLPLSASSTEQASYFDTFGTVELVVPYNAIEAYVELYVSGNALEEFFYANAPDEALPLLPGEGIFGKGPFREVQLLIDGRLAGFVTPFPVIYTGGIIPTAWRPIAAYGAFDEPTYVLNITPFLPLLCDDALHSFALRTVSASFSGDVNPNWWVSGNVRFLRGAAQVRTTGTILLYEENARPREMVTIESEPQNGILNVQARVNRFLHVRANLELGNRRQQVETIQSTHFSNHQKYYDGNQTKQEVWQDVRTNSRSRHGIRMAHSDDAAFLLATSTAFEKDNMKLEASIDQTFSRRQSLPSRAFPGFRPEAILTHQSAAGSIQLDKKTGRVAHGTGETSQILNFDYIDVHKQRSPTFWRAVQAKAGRLVDDHIGGLIVPHRQSSHGVSFPISQFADRIHDLLTPRWFRRFTYEN